MCVVSELLKKLAILDNVVTSMMASCVLFEETDDELLSLLTSMSGSGVEWKNMEHESTVEDDRKMEMKSGVEEVGRDDGETSGWIEKNFILNQGEEGGSMKMKWWDEAIGFVGHIIQREVYFCFDSRTFLWIWISCRDTFAHLYAIFLL